MKQLRLDRQPETIETGQLWRLADKEAAAAKRYALVTEIVRTREGVTDTVRVAPISLETWYAGPRDILVSASESPLGCSFMIECWNQVLAPVEALAEAVAELPLPVVRDCTLLGQVNAEVSKVESHIGFAVGERIEEERRAFQVAEQARLARLIYPSR